MAQKMVQDKVVVVTGAGGGIGRDMALALAAAGAKVVVNDIGTSTSGEGTDAGPAQKVVEEIKAAGGQAVANTDSVAEAVAAGRIVQCALDTFGRIDGVVNNAGILRDRFFHKMSLDEWDAVLKVHLYGSYYMSRAAANHFKEQESGTFVHMTSTSGLIGNFGQANYTAAKAGMIGLTKTAARELGPKGITVNAVAPGMVMTEMARALPAEVLERALQESVMRELATPDDIAAAVVFLLSDMARMITGEVIRVDAGQYV